MISVTKQFDKPPQSLIDNDCIQKIKQCLVEKGTHKFKSHYKKKDTKKKLIDIYNGKKCAYCEGTPATTSPIQVEHYRPKKKCRKKIPTHQGYYWLGYEWTNLLYACGNCNNSKGTQFPLEDTGIRITSHPMLN